MCPPRRFGGSDDKNDDWRRPHGGHALARTELPRSQGCHFLCVLQPEHEAAHLGRPRLVRDGVELPASAACLPFRGSQGACAVGCRVPFRRPHRLRFQGSHGAPVASDRQGGVHRDQGAHGHRAERGLLGRRAEPGVCIGRQDDQSLGAPGSEVQLLARRPLQLGPLGQVLARRCAARAAKARAVHEPLPCLSVARTLS
jgi:hypothetical protein